jgi:hypothetical protein
MRTCALLLCTRMPFAAPSLANANFHFKQNVGADVTETGYVYSKSIGRCAVSDGGLIFLYQKMFLPL